MKEQTISQIKDEIKALHVEHERLREQHRLKEMQLKQQQNDI